MSKRPGRSPVTRCACTPTTTSAARPGELLLRVLACGVCRSDLHVTEGDLPPHRPA